MEETAAAPQHRSTDRLGTESIFKLLLEFSIPGIVAQVFNALYNIVDSVFLGQAVGPDGIAVTTLAFPIMMITMALSALSGVGGNALAAITLGEGRFKEVERILGNTTVLLVVTAGIIAIIAGVFMDPLLALVGTTPDLWDKTKLFLQIIMFANVFQCLGLGINNFLRTAGKPNLALFTGMFGTLMCIVFNWVFVMMLGWGVAGSAWATVLGQACGMVPVLWYFILVKDAPFHLRPSGMAPNLLLMGKIMALGISTFVMQTAGALISILLNRLLVEYGAMHPIGSEGALSAVGVAGRVNSFAMMPVFGVVMGAQPIIGFNYGAHKWRRVRNAFWVEVLFATIIITAFFVVIHVFPTQLVHLFGVTGELEKFCIFALMVMSAMFPLLGFQISGSNYFQASGQPLKATVLGLLRQILFLVPLLIWLPRILPSFIDISGLEAVCVTYPSADVLSVILVGILIIIEMRKLKARAVEENDLRLHPLPEDEEAV